jgi:hypothetical protein
MAHVEGYYSVKSMAYRNCNPGNIEAHGKVRTYSNPTEGFTELILDIAVNAGKTLAEFLAKYAPPSENDTSTYVSVVGQLTGIKPEEVI